MLTSLLLAALLAAPQSSRVEAPPGMVLVKGGRTTIGTTEEEVRKLIEDNGQDSLWVREYPQHKVEVRDFFLMVSEVTNEQYLEFVRATGARPPEHWAQETIDTGNMAYLEDQNRLRVAAREQGKTFEMRAFDRTAWWNKNWEGAQWAYPEKLANHPVVYVDHPSAFAYARWAGLRLMSEQEYQRACRGDSTRNYPWGDDWKDGEFAHTFEAGKDRSFPVGSWPKGSVGGLFDLCGSVWEWTSSPFEPYPKYKPLEIVEGKGKNKEKRQAIARWEPDFRVSVGGSYKNPKNECRVTTRRSTLRFQTADALGFRCAATPQPGVDMASTVLREDLPASMRPEGVNYDAGLAIAMDRWTAEERKGPEGYRVITAYDYLLFIPAESVEAASQRELDEESVEKGPVHLGVFSSTQELVAPALKAGTYMVAYRGPGEPKKARAADASASTTPASGAEDEGAEQPAVPVAAANDPLAALRFDRTKPNLVFFDKHGEPVLAVPTLQPKYERPSAGRVTIDQVHYTPKEMEKDATLKPGDRVNLHFSIAKSSSRGFEFSLPLLLRPNTTQGWRY